MATQNFVSGNKTKIYFTILPDELYDNPTEPQDVTITTSAATAVNATTLAVTALSGPVPIGTPIQLLDGSNKVVVYTTASAKTGATALTVEKVAVAIASGATGTYKALLLLAGGKSADEQIQSNDEEFTVFNDGNVLNYSTGIVTRASWQLSYQFNVLAADLSYFRLAYAAQYAVNGVLGWLKKEDPVPKGYTTGESIAGVVAVTDFQKNNSAEGILSGQLTFKGRGKPDLKHYT